MLRMRESIASPVCCYSWSALSCWLLLLLICWPLTANYLAAYYCKSAKRFKSFTSTKWLRIWVCSNSWLLPEVQLPPPSETLSPLFDRSHNPTIPPGIQSLTWLGRLCLFDSKRVEREIKLKWERFIPNIFGIPFGFCNGRYAWTFMLTQLWLPYLVGAISPWLILIVTREGRGSCTPREVGQDPWRLPRSCREGQDRERQGCQRPWEEVSQGRRRLQKEAGELFLGGRGGPRLNLITWPIGERQEGVRSSFDSGARGVPWDSDERKNPRRPVSSFFFLKNKQQLPGLILSWKQTMS